MRKQTHACDTRWATSSLGTDMFMFSGEFPLPACLFAQRWWWWCWVCWSTNSPLLPCTCLGLYLRGYPHTSAQHFSSVRHWVETTGRLWEEQSNCCCEFKSGHFFFRDSGLSGWGAVRQRSDAHFPCRPSSSALTQHASTCLRGHTLSYCPFCPLMCWLLMWTLRIHFLNSSMNEDELEQSVVTFLSDQFRPEIIQKKGVYSIITTTALIHVV